MIRTCGLITTVAALIGVGKGSNLLLFAPPLSAAVAMTTTAALDGIGCSRCCDYCGHWL